MVTQEVDFVHTEDLTLHEEPAHSPERCGQWFETDIIEAEMRDWRIDCDGGITREQVAGLAWEFSALADHFRAVRTMLLEAGELDRACLAQGKAEAYTSVTKRLKLMIGMS